MTRLLVLLPVLLYFTLRVPMLLPERWSRRRWILSVFFGALMASGVGVLFYYRSYGPELDSPFFKAWLWGSTSGLAYLATILLILVPIDSAFLLFVGVRKALKKPQDRTRRAFAREIFGYSMLGLPMLSTAAGIATAKRGPLVKEVLIPIGGLHPDLHGLRIVQISDLHVGLTINRQYVENVVNQALMLKPDLIALTGDMMDGSVALLEKHIEPLKRLKAALGVFFVTGNHEYYSGAENWIAWFRSMGATFLLNEARVVAKDRAHILIAGVPDPAGAAFFPDHVADFSKAARVPGTGSSASGPTFKKIDFRLLLAHRPGACVEATRVGFDLQLSGHTHAGQFFPWNIYVPLAHPYVRGLNRHAGKTWVYVNAGTGYWGPPSRFTVPSEITLLRLVPANSAPDT